MGTLVDKWGPVLGVTALPASTPTTPSVEEYPTDKLTPIYRFWTALIPWGRGPIRKGKYLRLRCPQGYQNLRDCSRGQARSVGGRIEISDEGKLRGEGGKLKL